MIRLNHPFLLQLPVEKRRMATFSAGKKNNHPVGWLNKSVGVDLFSRAASSQVFSALLSLTTVFGMGTGGPSTSSTPTIYRYALFAH
mgnify:CR=1 FL=1